MCDFFQFWQSSKFLSPDLLFLSCFRTLHYYTSNYLSPFLFTAQTRQCCGFVLTLRWHGYDKLHLSSLTTCGNTNWDMSEMSLLRVRYHYTLAHRFKLSWIISNRLFLHHAIENTCTANQNTENPLYTGWYYTKPSYHALHWFCYLLHFPWHGRK